MYKCLEAVNPLQYRNFKGIPIAIKRGITNLLPEGRFLRGASQLVIGTVAGQVLVILSAPLLTRLYTPEEFGVLAVYVAILAFVASVSTLQYDIAVPLPRTDRSSTTILTLSLIASLIITAICAVAVAIYGHLLMKWTNTPSLAPYLWALPLGVLVGGAHRTFTYWGLRKTAFGLIARTRLQQGGFMATTQVLFGYLHWGVFGLIAGHVIGLSAGLFSLIRFWAQEGFMTLRRVTVVRLRKMAIRYKDLPVYSTSGALVNTIGQQLPLLLFAGVYSPTIAGLYLLGQRVANAPVSLFAEAIGKVFFVSAVEAQRDNGLPDLVLKVFEALLKICLAPLILLAIVAPELFAIVFGPVWSEAGRYLQIMITWIAASFVFIPLLTLCTVLYRIKADMYFQLALAVARVAGLWIGSVFGGPLMAVALFSLGGTVVYIGFGCWMLKASGVAYQNMIRVGLRELLFAAMIGALLGILKYFLVLDEPSIFNPAIWAFFMGALVLGMVALMRIRTSLKVIRKLSELQVK